MRNTGLATASHVEDSLFPLAATFPVLLPINPMHPARSAGQEGGASMGSELHPATEISFFFEVFSFVVFSCGCHGGTWGFSLDPLLHKASTGCTACFGAPILLTLVNIPASQDGHSSCQGCRPGIHSPGISRAGHPPGHIIPLGPGSFLSECGFCGCASAPCLICGDRGIWAILCRNAS